MAITTNFFNLTNGILLFIVAYLCYYWTVATYDYWKRLNIPYLTTQVPFFGNMLPFIRRRENYTEMLGRIYRSLDGLAYGGYFEMRNPILMIRDPHLIASIAVKDFSHFRDKNFDFFFNADNRQLNPLSAPLFALNGNRWKILRTKLTTAFTGGKLNAMLPAISRCVRRSSGRIISNIVNDDGSSIDAKEQMMNYTFDVMNACILGIDDCSSTEDLIRLAEGTTINNGVLRFLLLAFDKKSLDLFGVSDFPKTFTKLFVRFVEEIVRLRESTVDKTTDERKDFLQTMIDIKNGKVVSGRAAEEDNEHSKDGRFDVIDVAANAFGLFLGGYETTAGTLAFCLHELAFNQDVQDKLRLEINNSGLDLNDEAAITSEALKKLQYLDIVISETLRMYTPMPLISRVCVDDYVIPNTNIVVSKGTKLVIPPAAIHMDPNIYEQPEQFRPERFLPENKTKLQKECYLPFGIGPRTCLGIRFVPLVMKIVLIEIISKFTLQPNPESKYKIDYRKGEILSIPQKKLLLDVKIVKKKNEDA